MESKRRHLIGNGYELIKWLILVAVIVSASLYISSDWYQLMLIQGESMEPSYHHMQLVILDKHSKEYHTGDVVAFGCEPLSAVLVKRIAAGPGDRVQIINGTLCINGTASELYKECEFEYEGILSEEILLGNGQYVVIGDNVAESKDSRWKGVGVVDLNDVIGVVR